MENITVVKNELIAILDTNRIEHQEAYNEAITGWKIKVGTALSNALHEVERDGEPDLSEITKLVKPVSHIREYDRAIDMLKLSVDSEVSLSEYDYRQLVNDEWEWSRNFAATNSAYTR